MRKLQIVSLWVIALLWIGSAIGYIVISGEPKVELFFIILNGLGVIIAVLVSIYNGYNANVLKREQVNTQKFQVGFRYSENWTSDAIIDARSKTRSLIENSPTLEELSFAINHDNSVKTAIIKLANYWQTIHFLIERNMADEDAIRHFLSKPFLMWMERFRPWLASQEGQDKHVLEDLDDLFQRWKSNINEQST